MLERLLPVESEVVDDLGRWYIRHIVPYRTATDRIDGVVVTFTDITDRKRREGEVEAARGFAEAIVEAVRFPLAVLTPDLRVKSANAAVCETFRSPWQGQLELDYAPDGLSCGIVFRLS